MRGAHDGRDLITLGVHALLIGDVVPPLRDSARVTRGAHPRSRSEKQPAAGARRGAECRVAHGGTDRGACRRSGSAAGVGAASYAGGITQRRYDIEG
jgi:hypothetical protein